MTKMYNLSKFPINYARKIRCTLCGLERYTVLPNNKIPNWCPICRKNKSNGLNVLVEPKKEGYH